MWREGKGKVKERSRQGQGKVKATQAQLQPQPQLQFNGFWHNLNQPSFHVELSCSLEINFHGWVGDWWVGEAAGEIENKAKLSIKSVLAGALAELANSHWT